MYVIFSVGGDLLSHTLPHAVPSAINRLSYRVRKGTGRTPATITTNTLNKHNPERDHAHNTTCCVKHCTVDANTQQIFGLVTNLLVCYVRPISTSHLQHLHAFQPWPINPIISREPQKKPHLETGFPLRCFQRLSLPYVANQPCSWRNNWHTRGTSNPVLSY